MQLKEKISEKSDHRKYPIWHMRHKKGDKENIMKLAKFLNVGNSEAVRLAVKFALKHMKKES